MADHRDEDQLTKPELDSNAYEREETTDLKDETPDRPKGWPLHTRILIGLVVGVVAGISINALLGGNDPRIVWTITNITEPVGQLFLRLLLMIVIPLVFSSLVVGVAGIGDIRKLGRVGLKTFLYTLVISAISVVIGLTLANTVRPGERINPATAADLQQRYGSDATKAVEAAPRDPNRHDTLAYALRKGREFDRARASLERAVRLDPVHPAWRLSLAETLVEAGELEAARRAVADVDELVAGGIELDRAEVARLEQARAASRLSK